MITFENKFLIKSGENSLEYLFEYLNKFKSNKKLLIIDHNIKNLKIIKDLKINFKKRVKKYKFFLYQSKHEPTYENLNLIKKKFLKNGFEIIVAIGGGSTLDFSKGLSLLLKNKGNSEKYMGFPTNLNKPIPVIAIPSTFNTGSEIVYNAVFTSKKQKKKLGINYNQNFPILAILEPKLIYTSPKKLILSSAYSVFCRAVETYTTPESNYISKNYSLFSYKLICESLEEIFIKKNNKLETYNKLQWAGINSMIALSNVGGGIGGIGAYYFSVNVDLPQSIGYGVCSSEIFKENIKINKKIYKELDKIYSIEKMLNFFDNQINRYYSFKDYRLTERDKNIFRKTYENAITLSKNYNPCNFKKKNLTDISNRILKKF